MGAVLFLNNELYTLAWQFYADAAYSGSNDLENGIKGQLGWKAFTDDIGVWEHLKEADQAVKNTSIFMAVDKTDKATAATLAINANYRGKPKGGKGKEAEGPPPDADPGGRELGEGDAASGVEAATRAAKEVRLTLPCLALPGLILPCLALPCLS